MKKDTFYIVYCCIMMIVFFIRYVDPPEWINNILVVITCVSILLFFIYWINMKFTKREFLIQLIVIGCATLVYCLSGFQYEYIVLTALAVVGTKNVELKKITKYMFVVLLIVFVACIILALMGILPNTIHTKTDKFGNEYNTYTLGLGHGNTVYCILFTIIVLYIYSYFDKIKYIYLLFLEIICVGFYFLTYSRTGIIIATLLLLTTAMLKRYGTKIEKAKGIKIIKLLTLIFIPVMFLIVYLFSTEFYNGRIYNVINNLVTARLEVANYYIKAFGINFLPQNYELTTAFDNLYAFVMVTFGWGSTILICGVYFSLIKELWKEKKYLEIALIIIFAIYGFSEKMFTNVFRNMSILFFKDLLYKNNVRGGKMMKKICIIGCYFGHFRKDFKLWLKSCEYNDTIDFLIFTDCDTNEDIPNNVKLVHISFKELHELFNKKLDMEVILPKPYKLCDYKPMYGYIFSDYLKGYDFWGYCDFDLIFGNIRNFLTEDVLKNNDRIYHLGHLCIYRNNENMTKLFKSMTNEFDYRRVCLDKRINIFDEIGGMYQISKKSNVKFYLNIDYADINKFNRRLKMEIPKLGKNALNLSNHNKQLFVWEKGNLYVYYIENRKIERKELIYIHFSGREFNYIETERFIIDTDKIINLRNELISQKHFEKYNICYSSMLEKIIYFLKTYISRLKNHWKYNRMWKYE